MNVGKHWKPLKYFWMGILVVVFISSVTGCRQKNRNRQTISDAPDSFWQHVQMEIQEKTEVFSNDDNSYCMSMQDEEGKIIQQQLDGTLVQSHVVNQLEEIIRVTNERIYYTAWDSKVAGILHLWCVPIQKTGNDDQVVWEKKEVLLQDIMDISYITDSYVIYETEDGIYKLDLQNGDKFPVTVNGRGLDGRVVHCRNQEATFMDGKLCILEGANMYCLEPDSGAVKQIYTGVSWKDEDPLYRNAYMVSCGDSICFTCDNETVWQYRDGEDQAVCVVTKEIFLEKLKEIGLKKGKQFQDYDITEMFLLQDRVYFIVKEVKEEQASVADGRCCLFSVSISDLSKLQNESVVTDYWNSWEIGAIVADTVSDDIVTQAMYVYKPVRVAGIVDGKVILEGVRLSYQGRSMVEMAYCAAYDTALNQILERSDLKKVY